MTKRLRNSDSSAQEKAGEEILKKLSLKSHYVSELGMNIDGYSKTRSILCEVYVHFGKLNSGNINKVMKDALRLIAIRRVKKYKNFRLWLAFSDPEAAEVFKEKRDNWKARLFKDLEIEIKVVKLTPSTEREVRKARKEQE